ncbi:MAG: tail fiber domain-containing protein [Tateyamaria sp.]|uniref:tail fiber domain-containing protein n=1 Tax=Tateyamaria sp. TaxID=1929288 RepID=UPI00329D7CD3
MKYLTASVLCLSLISATAHAGGPSDPQIEPPVIVDDATSSSSGGVAVPLLLLAVVLIAATAGSNGATAAAGNVGVSDANLKTDIQKIGTTAYGLPLYNFRYIGGDQLFEGVMAQDVLKVVPEAVVQSAYGFYAVDYGMLGIEMRAVN